MGHYSLRRMATYGFGTATALLSLSQTSQAAEDNKDSPQILEDLPETQVDLLIENRMSSVSSNSSAIPVVETSQPTFTHAQEPSPPLALAQASMSSSLDSASPRPIAPEFSKPVLPETPSTQPITAEPLPAETSLPTSRSMDGRGIPYPRVADSESTPALAPSSSLAPQRGAPTSPQASARGMGEALPEKIEGPTESPATNESFPSMEQRSVSSPTPPSESLDTLMADPNPLLLPTQPQEVEVTDIQELTLEEAIALGYQNSESLQVVLLELERSQEALREERASLYPRVGLNLDLNVTESNSIASIPSGSGVQQVVLPGEINTSFSGAVEVNYDLFTSGRRSAAIAAARGQVRFNELSIDQQQKTLRLEITRDYYNLQEAIERVSISETFLKESERNLRDATVRYEAGIGTLFDVLRADIEVANAQQIVIQAQSQVDAAESRLARRLNLPSNVNVSTTDLSVAEPWPLSLEESIILAYQNRVELEQQLTDREINEQRQIFDRAATSPRVSLFASYSLQDELNRRPEPTDALRAGIRLNWDFYDGGAARARSNQREKDVEIAEVRFSETRNAIRQEVEESYFDLKSNLENVNIASSAVEQARRALEIATARFNSGIGTQLDLLSSTRELTDSQASLVTAIQNYNRAFAELQRAIGLPDEISP